MAFCTREWCEHDPCRVPCEVCGDLGYVETANPEGEDIQREVCPAECSAGEYFESCSERTWDRERATGSEGRYDTETERELGEGL